METIKSQCIICGADTDIELERGEFYCVDHRACCERRIKQIVKQNREGFWQNQNAGGELPEGVQI